MERICLDGTWRLRYFNEGDAQELTPESLDRYECKEIPASVPGNVELDLQAAGVIPDPFFGANIHLLRPFEFCQWWYTREFDLQAEQAAKHWELCFGGIDTLASVWVNHVKIAETENMLVEHRFPLGGRLLPGLNRIDVQIRSFVNAARAYSYDASVIGPDHRDEVLYIRKAPHMGGWDIMPRAISAGLWRSVTLEAIPEHRFREMYYWTARADDHGATLGARFSFDTSLKRLDGLSVGFSGVCGGHTFEHEWPVEFISDFAWIPVPRAKRWWPRGYGEPNLYTVTAQLLHNGAVLAERSDRIGIRAVTVKRTDHAGQKWTPGPKGDNARYDEEPDPASHFVFYVNGHPILCKGSNWVPLDAFHSRDIERVDAAMELVRDLNCNMVRCWGGNVYESDRFFDLCDESGVLVWQDFAFACGLYPQSEEFLAKVRAEAEVVVRRLRNHACLAIWCGDNEIDAGYGWVGGLSPESNRITREVLPRVLHRIDPRRSYVPSSPYTPATVQGDTAEQHLWGPRGYYKGAFYTHHSAHFIGEIGYHGCPNVSSIRKFISPEKLWPWQNNDEWHIHDTYHWRHGAVDRDRISLMSKQVREVFGGVPENIEDYALASQIVQAEAKKFFIESTRLRKWRTSGVLWWNVLDGWPQFSDAIVDYFWGKKLAYYYIRCAQLPVCLIVGEAGSEKYRPIVLCNDSLRDVTASYTVRDADSGETLLHGQAAAPANQNWQVGRFRSYASNQRCLLLEWECDGERFGNHYMEGTPPFTLEQCRKWLGAISALPLGFDPSLIAK